ncbi:MAG: hypothetical protein ACKO96_25720 [Flammeovirgaceae bacterium]
MKNAILFLMGVLPSLGFSQPESKPIIMLNGQIVKDSLTLNRFDRIDYIQGKKGVELLGPQGAKGVIIIQADGKIPLYGEVISENGKKVKGAQIMSKNGVVLTSANSCGTFFLPYIQIGETLIIRKKGYVEESILVQQSNLKIQLKKN